MAMTIAQKLHATIAATRVALPLGGMPLQSSIGVAESPTHGRRPAELMSAADVALYHSKRQGRNRVASLSPDASRATKSVFSQGFALRQALERGQMRPAFQPIYDIRSGREIAREVLARMRLPDSVVHAKDFIAVAEELGLTRELDLHIIRQALTLTSDDQALFLNVDLSSFNDRVFVNDLIALLAPARAAGRPITIEITERETVTISDTLIEDVQRLRALGCKLALDDFGSGYSTYYFLDQFRPDYLKIEGTFVRAMLESESAHKIVTHIHELAQSFGMETIAENVESEEIRSALAKIGIRNVQGWLFGEPQLAS
jgi:EAL domain-containing protein (putative c-di-GMP-specific phosphodiesterase class I)